MSKQDIITTLENIFKPFGYSVTDKIQNQNQIFQKWKLFLIWTELIISILVSFIPPEHLFQLTLLADGGLFLVGFKLRNIGNCALIAFRIHLALSQLHYVNDDFRWLLIANKLFNQIDYICIPPKVNKMIKRTIRAIRLLSYLLVIVILLLILNNKDFQQIIMSQQYYFYIHSVLFNIFFFSYHFYITCAFLFKLYFILKLSTWFSSQFNTKFQHTLNKHPNKPMVSHMLKQFSTFYQLIQQFNSHLKYSYSVMIEFLFTYGLTLFYLSFISDMFVLIRIVIYTNAAGATIVLLYFSVVAGSVDEQCKLLSDYIYRIAIIEKRFHISGRYIQVNFNTEIQCFPTFFQHSTIFLENISRDDFLRLY